MSTDWPAGGPDEFRPFLDQQLQDPEVRAAFYEEDEEVGKVVEAFEAGEKQKTAPPPHILTITEVDRGLRYSIECPGVTNDCRAWVDCSLFGTECDDDILDEEEFAHGIEHQCIDGDWMVPTDDCLVRTHFYLAEVAADLLLPAGRHPVKHDFGDGTEFRLTVLDPAGAVP